MFFKHTLVAIDNIGTVSVLSQIELIKKLCIENNIKLFVTTYYCIEEVFLSFEFFHKWVKNINKEYLILLHYVAECIRSRKNYFAFHSDCEAEFKKVLDRCKKEKNREQFAAQLLSLVTHNNSGFKISKDQLGPCWINNCCAAEMDVLKKNPRIKVYKRQCGISEDYLTAKEKLTIINKNSILATKDIIKQIV